MKRIYSGLVSAGIFLQLISGCSSTGSIGKGTMVSPPGRDIQTTLVPAGGSVVVDVEPEVPGTYTLLDHASFRTEKGAMGQLTVEGPPRPDIHSGR